MVNAAYPEKIIENNSNEKLRFLKICWMMYVLFPFRLNGIGVIQDLIYYAVSIGSIGILFFELNGKRTKRKYIINIFLYLLSLAIITVMAYFVPILKNTNDTSYLNYLLYYWGRTILLTGTLVLCKTVFGYIKLIIDAINLYVICSLVLLIPSLHNFYTGIVSITNVTSAEQMEQLYSQTYYTRFGLQGFSGFGATLMCTLAVLLSCYLIVVGTNKKKHIRPYFIRLGISIIGTALYGRIGLLVSVVLVAITFVYVAIFYNRYGMLFSVIFVVISLIILFVLNAQALEQISSINWMFEGFFNFLNTGKFSTQSSTVLTSMYIHPSLQTILYGDGYYTVMGKYYMSTDVGFLRPLLFFGIFGEIVYYIQVLPLLDSIHDRLKSLNGNFLIFSCLVLLVIFEFKGETLLTVGNTLFMIAGSILVNNQVSNVGA